MVRKLTGLMAALGMVVLVFASSNAADEKKPKTIKQVMKAANGKKGYTAKIAAAAKAGNWDDAISMSKEFAELAEDLGKNKPPRGEEDSWKVHTMQYAVSAKSFLTASEKKDGDGVAAASKSFGAACMACHKEHKPAK